jgi:hypothetical protein
MSMMFANHLGLNGSATGSPLAKNTASANPS